MRPEDLPSSMSLDWFALKCARCGQLKQDFLLRDRSAGGVFFPSPCAICRSKQFRVLERRDDSRRPRAELPPVRLPVLA